MKGATVHTQTRWQTVDQKKRAVIPFKLFHFQEQKTQIEIESEIENLKPN